MQTQKNEIEIELKSLLGTADKADAFRIRLLESNPCAKLTESKQLNHYFINGDYDRLFSSLSIFISAKTEQEKIKQVLLQSAKQSIRTREINRQDSLFICKASLNDESSENSSARVEVEILFKGWEIESLDNLLLSAGLSYQAKWSRDREEYDCGVMTVCLDRNAGYGWVAEFEKMVRSESEVEPAKRFLSAEMQRLELQELRSDRLERMFAFYCENWRKYYETDNVFEVL